MRLRATACFLLLSGAAAAAAALPTTRSATRPATAPATGPATRPADTAPVDDPVAEGWVVEQLANLNTTMIVTAPGLGVDLGGRLIFPAQVPDTGTELWQSDGTPQGTVLLKDINPGPPSSVPAELTVFNGRAYFL